LKKILFFHHFGGIGGAGLSLLHILHSIDKTKYHVAVVCPSHPNQMVNEIEKLDVKLIRTEVTPKIFAHYNGGIKYFLSIRTLVNLIDIINDWPRVKKIIEKNSPDIIVVNSMTLFWIGKIAKKRNIKTVCFHREIFQKGILGFRSWIIKKGLSRYFDKVSFISEFDMKKAGRLNAEKVLIHDKVDISKFSNYTREQARCDLKLDDNNKYVLFLGGFSKLKGSHIVMECMSYFSGTNIKLLFVLNDAKNDENIRTTKIKKIIKLLNTSSKMITMKIFNEHSLEETVVFLKPTINPELYYKASDIVVFPSTRAHQARPIYEAGIARIPIVISDFKETSEFAINNETALTFKPGDPKDLYSKIKICLNNKSLKEKIINNNYYKSINEHNLSMMIDEIQRLLHFD